MYHRWQSYEAVLTLTLTPTPTPYTRTRTGWVQSYETHPVRAMFDAGVRVSLNSDNLLLSGSADRAASPTGELLRLVEGCGFSWAEAREVLRNGPRAAFLPDEPRAALVEAFDRELDVALRAAGVEW